MLGVLREAVLTTILWPAYGHDLAADPHFILYELVCPPSSC
jgi:hypothetical protein